LKTSFNHEEHEGHEDEETLNILIPFIEYSVRQCCRHGMFIEKEPIKKHRSVGSALSSKGMSHYGDHLYLAVFTTKSTKYTKMKNL